MGDVAAIGLGAAFLTRSQKADRVVIQEKARGPHSRWTTL